MVGETAGSATALRNYPSVITGVCASDGNITLAAGENKVCTITNTRNGPPNFVVTKTDDTDVTCAVGDCSLREAINAANSDPDTNTITFDIPLSDGGCNGGLGPCTIMLSNGQLAITQSVNVDNSGSGEAVVVDANSSGRAFLVSGPVVTISDLTITRGDFPGFGAALFNHF